MSIEFNLFENKLDKIKEDVPSEILQLQLKIESLERQNEILSKQLVAILDVIQKVSEINLEIDKKMFKTLSNTQNDALESIANLFKIKNKGENK